MLRITRTQPKPKGESSSAERPYLVLLDVLGVGEVHDGGEVVDVGAAQPALEEVADEHGADVGFARPRGAVEGQHQGLGGARAVQELLQPLHQLLPHQGLPHQAEGQVALQTWSEFHVAVRENPEIEETQTLRERRRSENEFSENSFLQKTRKFRKWRF